MKSLEGYVSSFCGADCEGCEFFAKEWCSGCFANGGRNYLGDDCAVSSCAKTSDRRFCGECSELPCELLTKLCGCQEHSGDYPGLLAGQCIDRCRDIKRQMVAAAREGREPVGFCGHDCGHCFLGQWCGGCRSDYNCASYATICSGLACPNVECASARKFIGCWECPDLTSCQKGYYSITDEYAAKAMALFISRHGLECCRESLARAISFGFDYPGTMNEAGSVEKAAALLEKYIG